jgi:hypothetical protein
VPEALIRPSASQVAGAVTVLAGTSALLSNPAALHAAVAAGEVILETAGEAAALATPAGWVVLGAVAIGGIAYLVYEHQHDDAPAAATPPSGRPATPLPQIGTPPFPAEPPGRLPTHTGHPAEPQAPSITTGRAEPTAQKPQIEAYPSDSPQLPNAVHADTGGPSKPGSKDQNRQRAIRNKHLAGGTHPKTGIPFDKNGYPDFKGSTGIQVTITPTGSRQGDERAANKAAGLPEKPQGFEWHHHQDGTTMQLVPKSIHRKTGHTGRFKPRDKQS